MRVSLVCGLLVGALLAGCRQETATAPLMRVNVVTAQVTDFAPEVTLTGTIAAQVQSEESFRVGGKIAERLANIGDHVTANQVLARLDPEEQRAELEAAKAGVQSAEATLRQTTSAFERQKNLLATGNTTRREYDQADAAARSAEAQLAQAQSQLAQANDQLAYTELRAGADGIIVQQMAEAGQVVAQAQPVFMLARDGPRDAVFNVHEWALANVDLDKGIQVSLVNNPAIRSPATVRVVSPAVDANTMTVQVKLALATTPPAMTLGRLVNGTALTKARQVVLLPWRALFEQDGDPAVWIVDGDTNGATVSLKPVAIERLNQDTIAVTGLTSGQKVVSAGTQMLRPGQKVEIAEARP
ncbi:MAG TPA: efflux RND transporter periplasmic adaptor subunit [Reyranella sp.]|nr:efflux RND transporter periplasmic adaptor subunit [Reyranella sp.]